MKAGKKKKKLKLNKRNRLLAVPIVLAVVLVGYFVVKASFAASPPKHDRFIDISSPQCGIMKSMPTYSFGIVGLNGTYMAFGVNPCLAEQVRHFKTYDLYVGVNYPSKHCGTSISAYQCGKKAASYDLGLISIYKLRPETIWIDAETGPRIPWSTQENNRQYLRGVYDQLRTKYSRVRYYSTPAMWNSIVGNMSALGYNWLATGTNNSVDARKYCSRGFGGGKTLYVQYVQNNQDYNLLCN